MSDTTLVLRTCAADMTSHSGFVWPEAGPVEAPDWSPHAIPLATKQKTARNLRDLMPST